MKEIIKNVFISKTGRTVKGTNFTKGDYIPLEKAFMGITNKGRQLELDRAKVLLHTGGVRLTMTKLVKVIGELADKYKK